MEFADIKRQYLERNELHIELLGGTDWLDTGTHDSLLEAASFIQTIEKRKGLKIASPEEIAYHGGYIGADDLELLSRPISHTTYGRYLQRLVSVRAAGEIDFRGS